MFHMSILTIYPEYVLTEVGLRRAELDAARLAAQARRETREPKPASPWWQAPVRYLVGGGVRA